MSSENSIRKESRHFLFKIADKIDLRRAPQYIYNLDMYYK